MREFVLGDGIERELLGVCLSCSGGKQNSLLCIFWCIGTVQATNSLLRWVDMFSSSQGVQWWGDHDGIWQCHVRYCLGLGGIPVPGRQGFQHCRTSQIAWIWIGWGLLLQGPGVHSAPEDLSQRILWFFVELSVDEINKQGGRKEGDPLLSSSILEIRLGHWERASGTQSSLLGMWMSLRS